jgi:site-specific recombinase XerD
MSAAKRTPANKGRRYPAEILTADEVRALLRACSTRAPTGIRNRAPIVALYRGGLRISEGLALKPKDLDRKAGTVRVLQGKGKRARTVGFDPTAFAMIERWLERRADLGIKKGAPIFCTLDEKPLKTAYVRALLPRLAGKAGIEKRVHVHGLRHTHAAELAREGVPMNVIQAQLGHSNLGTTSRYLAHIAPAEVIRVMQGREWEV